MLSFFPALLDWNWYVPLFFRVFLGYYFFDLGLRVMKEGDDRATKIAGIISTLSGIMFIAGVVVQLLAVVTPISSLLLHFTKSRTIRFLHESTSFYILLALVSFSLLFLGAGPYAIDLPL
jgi:uncharacterized membrane protein YphA (DoxX/SURF4 family)